MTNQIDLRGQPNAINILHQTQKFYEAAQEPAGYQVEIDPSEHSVDGFIELGWDHLQLQRTLHLDFQHEISGWDRTQLEAEAAPHIDQLNSTRAEQGAPTLAVSEMDNRVLTRLIEPQWLHLTGDENYDALTKTYPEHMKANLDELRTVDAKLRILSEDDQLRTEAKEHSHAQTEIIRAATAWIKTDERIDGCAKRISDLYQAAASSGRALTKADHKHIARLEAQQADLRAKKGSEITNPNLIAPTVKQIERLERRKRRREFQEGLVITESMKQVVTEVLPSLARGNPALFVGETGGAKTALAEFIAKHYMGKVPELISGYSDVNGYQLMGKTGLNSKDGATVSEFIAGPVIRAMEAGVPLILDEINAMPPEFMKRLNKIMQLRPGDRMTVQEDSGREVFVQPGFCILATANEKSKRYKGVDDLSTELQNRFAASTYRIRYPDHDIANGQVPKENLMIAIAALTDEIGEFSVDLPEGQLENFVKAAHITQKLFSGSFNQDEATRYLSTSNRVDGEGLETSVLAPRTMVMILEEVRASYGSLPLDTVMKRWLDGVKSKSDKAVLQKVLSENHVISK